MSYHSGSDIDRRRFLADSASALSALYLSPLLATSTLSDEPEPKEHKPYRIFFKRRQNPLGPTTEFGYKAKDNEAEIWAMDDDANNQTRLTHNDCEEIAAVSPNGRFLLYTTFTPDKNLRNTHKVPSHLYTMDLETGKVVERFKSRPMEHYRNLVLSRDGRTLAAPYLVHYDKYGPEMGCIGLDICLFRFDPESGEITPDFGRVVGKADRNPWHPSLSPDGKMVACSDLSGCIVVNGKEIKLSYPRGGKGYHKLPSWSPQGNRILFQASNMAYGDNHISSLYLMNPDGSETRKLCGIRYGKHGVWRLDDKSLGSWSPDGKRVALKAGPSHEVTFDSHEINRDYLCIYAVDAESGKIDRLTDLIDTTPLRFPVRWSPDGKKLVFEKFNYEKSLDKWCATIHTMNADGSGMEKLTDGVLDIAIDYI